MAKCSLFIAMQFLLKHCKSFRLTASVQILLPLWSWCGNCLELSRRIFCAITCNFSFGLAWRWFFVSPLEIIAFKWISDIVVHGARPIEYTSAHRHNWKKQQIAQFLHATMETFDWNENVRCVNKCLCLSFFFLFEHSFHFFNGIILLACWIRMSG